MQQLSAENLVFLQLLAHKTVQKIGDEKLSFIEDATSQPALGAQLIQASLQDLISQTVGFYDNDHPVDLLANNLGIAGLQNRGAVDDGKVIVLPYVR